MNKHILRLAGIGIGGLLLAGGAWTAVAAGPGNPTPNRPAATAPATSTLSAATASDLVFVRDEERLARDLYAAIAAQYGDALPFSTIVNSEQRHFDAVGVLLERYGLADPASGQPAGQYANPALQSLYDTLLAQSKISLAEAYKVGIAVETRDIADVKKGASDATQADVDRVFTMLLNGSEKHLSAFTDAANGVTHTETDMRGQASDSAATHRNGMGAGTGAGNRSGGGQGDRTCISG
ncbi:MAG: DUF2202 domain-containing protein [Propionibacteriaceae bacterium]|nr:DUF2202 domain-containing protein [Micropruina sp.]HBX79663.1 hypothetical protein [Propionibacteriaceae bacterium]HBY23715.1 hypothetical protein [Propionibacteriaceae bacterium]